MPAFIKFDGIDGESATEGYEKWTEILSFDFGVGRRIAHAGSTSTREGTTANVSEIVVKKVTDGTSVKYFKEALCGELDNTVHIAMVRTGSGKPEKFLGFELTNTGVAGMSFKAAGGPGVDSRPGETLHLNFSKVQMEYLPIGNDLTGSPDRYTWDMKTSTGS